MPARRKMHEAASSILLTILLMMAVGACGPRGEFTRRGAELPPRQADCALDVIDLPVGGRYEVLGVIDISAVHQGSMPRTSEAFRDTVTEAACDAGGDAVIAIVTGSGRYIQAVVIVRDPPEATGDGKPAVESSPEQGDS